MTFFWRGADENGTNSVRERIDAIDNELTRLFTERMQTVAEVARVKKATGKVVRDPARERAVVNRVTGAGGRRLRTLCEEPVRADF